MSSDYKVKAIDIGRAIITVSRIKVGGFIVEIRPVRFALRCRGGSVAVKPCILGGGRGVGEEVAVRPSLMSFRRRERRTLQNGYNARTVLVYNFVYTYIYVCMFVCLYVTVSGIKQAQTLLFALYPPQSYTGVYVFCISRRNKILLRPRLARPLFGRKPSGRTDRTRVHSALNRRLVLYGR